MLKRFCDSCGKEISPDETFGRLAMASIREGENPIFNGDMFQSDLCSGCIKKTCYYIIDGLKHRKIHAYTGESADTTTPLQKAKADEAPKKKRKPLDTGKIMALHNAGWTYKMIAEEMHCSMSTIYNVLINSKKEEDNDK